MGAYVLGLRTADSRSVHEQRAHSEAHHERIARVHGIRHNWVRGIQRIAEILVWPRRESPRPDHQAETTHIPHLQVRGVLFREIPRGDSSGAAEYGYVQRHPRHVNFHRRMG